MKKNAILETKEVDIKNLSFKKENGKIIQAKYLNTYFNMVTPKLTYCLPVKYEKLRITLFLPLKTEIGMNSQPKSSTFSNLFRELDDYIPKLVYKHRKEWFDDENIWDEEFQTFFENYRPLVQTDKETGNDCVKFNLPNDLDNIVFNSKNQSFLSMGLDALQELAFSKHRAALLLKCRGIWIVEEAYGLSWDVVQIKLFHESVIRPVRPSLPIGCHFISELNLIKDHNPGLIIMKQNNLIKEPQKAVSDIEVTEKVIATKEITEKPINYLIEED